MNKLCAAAGWTTAARERLRDPCPSPRPPGALFARKAGACVASEEQAERPSSKGANNGG